MRVWAHSRRAKTIDLARRSGLFCKTDGVLRLTYAKSVTFAHARVPNKRSSVPAKCCQAQLRPALPWAAHARPSHGRPVHLHHRPMPEFPKYGKDSRYAWAAASAQRKCTPMLLHYRPMTEFGPKRGEIPAMPGAAPTSPSHAPTWALAISIYDENWLWGTDPAMP